MVILDNSTRWNSTFLSLRRALNLRKCIDIYWFEHQADLNKDKLQEADWKQIQEVVKGLHPFYEVTKRLEGRAKNGHHGAI